MGVVASLPPISQQLPRPPGIRRYRRDICHITDLEEFVYTHKELNKSRGLVHHAVQEAIMVAPERYGAPVGTHMYREVGLKSQKKNDWITTVDIVGVSGNESYLWGVISGKPFGCQREYEQKSLHEAWKYLFYNFAVKPKTYMVYLVDNEIRYEPLAPPQISPELLGIFR